MIANPRDIDNYLVEFYNLANSVQGASKEHGANLSDIANFEQLVQLGQSGNLDANDQHVVTLNPGANSQTFVFVSTAYCIRSTRSRCPLSPP